MFPAALLLGNYVLIRKNGTDTLRLAAEDLPGTLVSCPIDRLDEFRGKAWGSYQLGVCHELILAGHPLFGADMLFFSTLPFGAGLSSSASIEVVTAFALCSMLGTKPDMTELALLCQRAENNFVGVNCGIMDQFACANGAAGHGMLLDCATLEYAQVPLNMEGYSLVIGNTGKKRGLADSKYNERRGECEYALAFFRKKRPELNNLCELDSKALDGLLPGLDSEKAAMRARHAVEENERVLKSVGLLKKGDIAGFGRLLDESHFSLRDLYEVTGRELDAMTDAARSAPGCIGSRMTGAGFGGCTVSIVKKPDVEDFISEVCEKYREAAGLLPEFYISGAGNGPAKLDY